MLDRRTYDALERTKETAPAGLGAQAANAINFVDAVAREAFRIARLQGFRLDPADDAERAAEALARWIVDSNPALAEIVRTFGKEPA